MFKCDQPRGREIADLPLKDHNQPGEENYDNDDDDDDYDYGVDYNDDCNVFSSSQRTSNRFSTRGLITYDNDDDNDDDEDDDDDGDTNDDDDKVMIFFLHTIFFCRILIFEAPR